MISDEKDMDIQKLLLLLTRIKTIEQYIDKYDAKYNILITIEDDHAELEEEEEGQEEEEEEEKKEGEGEGQEELSETSTSTSTSTSALSQTFVPAAWNKEKETLEYELSLLKEQVQIIRTKHNFTDDYLLDQVVVAINHIEIHDDENDEVIDTLHNDHDDLITLNHLITTKNSLQVELKQLEQDIEQVLLKEDYDAADQIDIKKTRN